MCKFKSHRPKTQSIFFSPSLHVAADGISFAATFLQKSPLTHSVAAPFPEPNPLSGPGCDSAFYSECTRVSFLSKLPTSPRTAYRSRRLFAKVASHSFCRGSFPNRNRWRWVAVWLFILIAGTLFCQCLPRRCGRHIVRSDFFCKSRFSLILSQLLSESNPLSLGFDSAFYSDWGTLFCQCFPRRCGRHIVRSDFFAKVASHSFCRSSFPNRTRCRWASIRFFILIGAPFFVNASHVAADGISFAATFLQKSLLTHSVAAPFRIEPAIAGLRFGFFILKTNAVSHSLRRSSFAQKVTLGSPARLQAPPRRLAVAATCEVKVTSKFSADVFFATC